MECNLADAINNITETCDKDMEVIKDNCKVLCLISINHVLVNCYFQIFQTGLLENMKNIIKYCYWKKFN
jgi:hypothetical protein